MPHAWVEIDLPAVRANLRELRKLLPQATEVIAMVKGNAYGHGAVPISRCVSEAGATHLGVAFISEGITLREAGIEMPLLVLGSFVPEECEAILDHRLTPAVSDMRQGKALSRAASERGATVSLHVKIDTGMGRLGIDYKKAPYFIRNLERLPGLRVEGIYTHLATADEADPSFSHLQLRRFASVTRALERESLFVPFRHAANSAGCLNFPDQTSFNAIRPGLVLYGLYPSDETRRTISLSRALSFRSRVVQVKSVPRGTFISYGRTYRTPQVSWIATVSVGYADGYPRSLGNKAQVLIRGKRYPVVGNVTMDHIMVDLDQDGMIQPGERVTLIGKDGSEEITAEELADLSGTIHYEVTTRIGPRVPRFYTP